MVKKKAKKAVKEELKSPKKKIKWKVLIWSFIAVYAVALIGSLLTNNAVNSSWYQSVKPQFTPPNIVFPIVWTALFFLIFISLYLSLVSAKNKHVKLKLEFIFGINLLLNIFWSFFYFFIKNQTLAFVDLILLWISILAMIYITAKVNRKSALLLFPYLLWVAFAGILNYLSIAV
jgi:tryptophan-rich sensory protein